MKHDPLVKFAAPENIILEAHLLIPSEAVGIVLFAHGSGSSRHSPRNTYVAQELNKAGLGTLLIDLPLTKEDRGDSLTRRRQFEVWLLADRLIAAARFLRNSPSASGLRMGIFGGSIGGGAAVVAAARKPDWIKAVVSRGGRPDLAFEALSAVQAPTLLIVGGNDPAVIHLNENAYVQLQCEKRIEIIPGAGHLFSEPGALDQVALLAKDWFQGKLCG